MNCSLLLKGLQIDLRGDVDYTKHYEKTDNEFPMNCSLLPKGLQTIDLGDGVNYTNYHEWTDNTIRVELFCEKDPINIDSKLQKLRIIVYPLRDVRLQDICISIVPPETQKPLTVDMGDIENNKGKTQMVNWNLTPNCSEANFSIIPKYTVSYRGITEHVTVLISPQIT